MHYKERTLHRLQEQFLVVGAHDLDELSQNMPRCDRNVEISMDALCCLQYLPNVENLILTSGYVSDPDDFQFLTGLKIRSLKIDYYAYDIDCMTIDLSIFPALEIVFSRTQYGFQNVAGCIQLQTLIVQEWLTDDLQSLSSSSIRALEIFSIGKLKSLSGAENMRHLVSLSVCNQRQLVSCSQLGSLHLESLKIESCNKVDYTQLPIMPELRMLFLRGKVRFPDISFVLSKAPNLEWLLLDHVVEWGELTPLQQLKHAVIFTDCRHYSHKNHQLPKSKETFLSKHLPMRLAILP